ncbi:MAG: 4-hydroxy-tetrahydrodipicolinate reductase [Deltaproteobacteria bacterium]|nr:4-hydroxy-tetrahydrodipicolinate reductase [Deltaproteobacteria bacterium]
MVKAIVLGGAGRMGLRIINLIHGTEGIEVAGAVERKGHPAIGRDVGEIGGLGRIGISLSDDLAAAIGAGDVVIDFTHHEAVTGNLKRAVDHGKAAVIGTTGLSEEEQAEVQRLAPETRCVFTPNMSVGVNVLFKVMEYVTAIAGNDFDIEIIEAHHNLKKDAPSGTAVKLAQIIARGLDRNLDDVAVHGRSGMVGQRTAKEIGIHAVRAGDIVGEHTILFGGLGERLEFTHRAHSRDNFAKGAIKAALWIVNQPKGLYDMQDVLGLRV